MDPTRAIHCVNQTLIEEFEIEPGRLVKTARLREDLGLDSLDAVDLIVALERALDLHIPEEATRTFRTVGDLHAYVGELAPTSP